MPRKFTAKIAAASSQPEGGVIYLTASDHWSADMPTPSCCGNGPLIADRNAMAGRAGSGGIEFGAGHARRPPKTGLATPGQMATARSSRTPAPIRHPFPETVQSLIGAAGTGPA